MDRAKLNEVVRWRKAAVAFSLLVLYCFSLLPAAPSRPGGCSLQKGGQRYGCRRPATCNLAAVSDNDDDDDVDAAKAICTRVPPAILYHVVLHTGTFVAAAHDALHNVPAFPSFHVDREHTISSL